MDQPQLMIYGATGYTGRLVAAEAIAQGLRPVLAGRNARKLAAIPGALGLERRAVALDDADELASALDDVTVVAHCAGPFSHTAERMLEACLASGTHYVDITGEAAVLEALASRDTEAKQAGIMVLPGAGFDVVPSDCLIADLAARHPGGRRLRLALAARSGLSHGTLRTILEDLGTFPIRRDGEIVQVAPGSLCHEFDFEDGTNAALVSGWGDVATAYRSTGIADIETYSQASRQFRSLTWMSRRLGLGFVRGLLHAALKLGWAGPSERGRQASYVTIVAEIEDADGRRAAARLHAPDPYGFTAKAVTKVATRVLRGDLKVGYQTPSSAYGAAFVRQFEGVEWNQLDTA